MTETDNAAEAARDADAGAPLEAEAAALDGLDATALAQLVAGASDEMLAQGMADAANRKQVLDEIFRRMAEHVNVEAAKGVEAVVHFRITEHPEGGEDVYEVVIESGSLQVTSEPGREPRVAFVVGPVDFLRLVSGNAAGPMLFMSGKLRIEGDMMFAAQLTSLFTIPSSQSA